jgi:hypothetical protein
MGNQGNGLGIDSLLDAQHAAHGHRKEKGQGFESRTAVPVAIQPQEQGRAAHVKRIVASPAVAFQPGEGLIESRNSLLPDIHAMHLFTVRLRSLDLSYANCPFNAAASRLTLAVSTNASRSIGG